MKLEITNKQLEQDLTTLADKHYLPPELYIKQILEEHISANIKQDSDKITPLVTYVKGEAKGLANVINNMLDSFANKFDVEVKLVEDLTSTIRKYKLEVKL